MRIRGFLIGLLAVLSRGIGLGWGVRFDWRLGPRVWLGSSLVLCDVVGTFLRILGILRRTWLGLSYGLKLRLK